METPLWFSNTVFTAAGEDRGCWPLSCKQKGQATVPRPPGQTQAPAARAAPCSVCAAGQWWPRQQLSTVLVLRCHSCTSRPANASVAPLQKGRFREFIDFAYTASCVKMLRPSLKKENLFSQTHLKICLCRKTCMDIIIFKKAYLFT